MKFSVVLLLVQAAFIALFAVFVDYGDHAVPQKTGSRNESKFNPAPEKNDISIYYQSK